MAQGSDPLSNHHPAHPGKDSNLRVAVALHIHEGKGTDVTNPSHIHSKMMKKVNNFQGTRAKPKEQEQWREERGQELLQEGDLGKKWGLRRGC